MNLDKVNKYIKDFEKQSQNQKQILTKVNFMLELT